MIWDGSGRGFTLIELLVVIAIIGILSVVVLASMNIAQANARDSRRLSDLKEFEKALLFCYDKLGSYSINAETRIDTPGYREPTTDFNFVDSWNARCAEFMRMPLRGPGGEYYVIHTSDDYQHFVLLTELERPSPNVMTSTEVAEKVLHILGDTGWTPDPRFNYVIGQ